VHLFRAEHGLYVIKRLWREGKEKKEKKRTKRKAKKERYNNKKI